MIELGFLDLGDRAVALDVLHLQRLAYGVEADQIGSDTIPPLQETLEELQACGETFLGAIDNGEIVGAISWRVVERTLDIHRLVVRPDHFRRGIATSLVRAALEAEPGAKQVIVQTGTGNAPAEAFYLREGFEHVDDLDVAGGIRVARFGKLLPDNS
jgi:GNAT superfamily N-acetyltransferase